MSAPVTWPYSTLDEVSHLVETDVEVLRARIDMLIEERRDMWKELNHGTDYVMPAEWRLTPTEERLVRELLRTPVGKVASKERLHVALSPDAEPETDIKIVDVLICKVRQKLGAEMIETSWGRGYCASEALRSRVRA